VNESYNVYILFFASIIVAAYLGDLVHKRREKSIREKLIKDLEEVLPEPLPLYYKKAKHLDPVNWDRVLNILKKQPPNEKISELQKRVERQIVSNNKAEQLRRRTKKQSGR